MRGFIAFVKKELLESLRSGKLMILGILFCAFGIMNPAIAKLTPWLMEMLAEELAESGMTVTDVTVDALTSWTQFYKNIPMALIAFVLLCGSSFTKEYAAGTLIPVLTKGLSRVQVLLAKSAVLLAGWTAGYWLCYGITFAYNAYYWDNGIAKSLGAAAAYWWLFGVFTVALTVLFSTWSTGYAGVLLGTGGSIMALYTVSLIPKAADLMPTALMNGMAILTGAESSESYATAAILTAAVSLACLCIGIPVFNKKQL